MFRLLRETFHKGRYKRIKPLLAQGTLLDIGCGKPCDSMPEGAFIKFMGRGTGMDIKDIPNADFEFKQGDILDIPFAAGSFDNVVAMHVLEHITDVDRALENVKRVLKDDGVFVMTTPDCKWWWNIFWEVWERTVGHMWHDEHPTKWGKKQWLAAMERHFKVESVQERWGFELIVKARKS